MRNRANQEELKITGSLNYCFYPYKPDGVYGNQKGSIDPTVLPPIGNKTGLGSNLIATEIPNCPECRNNKTIVFTLLQSAQSEGINKHLDKTNEHSSENTATVASTLSNNNNVLKFASAQSSRTDKNKGGFLNSNSLFFNSNRNYNTSSDVPSINISNEPARSSSNSKFASKSSRKK